MNLLLNHLKITAIIRKCSKVILITFLSNILSNAMFKIWAAFLQVEKPKKVFEAEKPCDKNRRLMIGFNTMWK